MSSIEAEEHKEIQLVHELFQGIAAEDPDAPDISMAEYLCRKGATHTVIQLAQCKIHFMSTGTHIDTCGKLVIHVDSFNVRRESVDGCNDWLSLL